MTPPIITDAACACKLKISSERARLNRVHAPAFALPPYFFPFALDFQIVSYQINFILSSRRKKYFGNTSGDQINVGANKTQAYGLAGNDTIASDGKSDVLLVGGSGNDSLRDG